MSACEQWVIELPDELVSEAARLRASGALGKPGPLSRLFEFLLGRSGGSTPKEIEIAVAVFNKKSDFDIGQDALVRVYVHKLRKRLEEYYLRNPGARRMVIPKGEYRLVVEAVPGAVVEVVQERVGLKPDLQPDNKRQSHAAVILAFVLGVVLAVGAALVVNMQRAKPQAASASPIWSSLLADDLPVTIVVGDYYLLGEANPQTGHIDRLVREFFINSHEDFRDHAELNPQLMQRYRNLDLTYLPAASAFALQDIVPVLGTAKPVRVVLMSQLDANALKNSHIVYIGYISGLGMLGDRVFAASRVSPGGSYDELVDTKTDHTYLSTAMGASSDGEFRDYGYFSTFAGPNGNRVVVIAGTRDIGVMQIAQSLAARHDVDDLCKNAGKAPAFESLVEISGMGKTGFKSRSLFVSGMKAEKIWESG